MAALKEIGDRLDGKSAQAVELGGKDGELFNVPNGKFGSTYQSTFVDCINWLIQTDRSKFVCANELHWLFQDGSSVPWRSANCDRFLDVVVKFWDDG